MIYIQACVSVEKHPIRELICNITESQKLIPSNMIKITTELSTFTIFSSVIIWYEAVVQLDQSHVYKLDYKSKWGILIGDAQLTTYGI